MSMYRRVRSLFSRSRIAEEVKAELQSHIDLRTEENLAAGMEPAPARRLAIVHFGNPVVIGERVTSMDAALGLESLWSDLRYALRQLRKSPGFALTVVTTVALCIGANLAVFLLLYGVMFARLPIAKPGEIYSVHGVKSPFDEQYFFSYSAYQRLRQAASGGEEVIARSGLGEGVFDYHTGNSDRVSFQMVSGNFFSVLGVSPFAGRLFVADDDRQGQNEWPVVLRYGYARQRFGLGHFGLASEGLERFLLGKRAVLNGISVVIVGIAADGFSGVTKSSAPDIWLPLEAKAAGNDPSRPRTGESGTWTGQLGTWFDSLGPGYGIDLDRSYLNQPGVFWLWVLARVPEQDRATPTTRWTAVIQPDLAMMAAATKDAHKREQILAARVELIPAAAGEGALGEYYALPLKLLMAMAAMIFLVGCLNLANLQLARLWSRQREIALRMALGASRWRVLRQVLVENMLLALLGGMLALVTGRAASSLLLHWASGRTGSIPLDLHIGSQVLALGALLLLGSLLAFALLPALWVTRGGFPADGSTRNKGAAGQSRGARRWSSGLLAGQVSISLLLVGMAGLFGQTLIHLAQMDAGMDREHVLSIHLDMRSTGFAQGQGNLTILYREMIERLKALPQVQNAAVQMCTIPQCGWNTAIHIFGRQMMAESQMHGEENHIGSGYFQTLGIPLLQGRDFNDADRRNTEQVAILNHAYATKLFGEESPIGHWVGYGPSPEDHRFRIVGEVGDARVDGLRSPAPPVVYLPINQNPQPIQSIEVRTAGSLDALSAQIRQTLRQFKPDLPITEIVSLDTEFGDGLTTETLLARLTEIFAALSLLLAALGFYGLLSFRVSRRTAEIGVRMALGATCLQVQRMVFQQTLFILIAGLLPGLGMLAAMAHVAKQVLYDPGKTDWVPLVFAVLSLVAVGMMATLLPARRAAAVDPMEALRSE